MYFDPILQRLVSGEKGGSGSSATMSTVTDNTSTTASLAIASCVRKVFTQPLTSLTVSSVVDSEEESEIVFTAGTGITVSFPESLGFIGEPSFEAGKSYIINIRNNVAVCAEYSPGVE